jgi:rubredoxin
MTTNFQINGIDTDDLLVRKEYFTEGGLWVWGYNVNLGVLGTNNNTSYSSPVQTVSGGTNWKSLSVNGLGGGATGAIKSDGTLWVWGGNQYGSLGTNDRTYYSSPVQTVAGGTNWKQASINYYTSGAIKTDGTLWLWGVNTTGELGDNTLTPRSSPVQTVAGGTNWKFVITCSEMTAALKTDGTLWLWGANSSGGLGDNTAVDKSSPVQTVASGTSWKQVSICPNATGFVGAIKTDGTLWMWGYNPLGQLGTNDRTSRSSPVQTIAGGTNWKQVSCGALSTAAIKTDGTLWVWGYNSSGQLGTNDVSSYSSPVQTVASGTNWKSVSTGGGYSTAAIKTDGTLWVWGSAGGSGYLGTNDNTDRSSPVQTVAGGTNWKQVYSWQGMAAIRTDYW